MFSHSVIKKNLLTIVTVAHGFAAKKRPCAAAFKRAKNTSAALRSEFSTAAVLTALQTCLLFILLEMGV